MAGGTVCQPWRAVQFVSRGGRYSLSAVAGGTVCQPWQVVTCHSLSAVARWYSVLAVAGDTVCQPWRAVQFVSRGGWYSLSAVVGGTVNLLVMAGQ